MKGWLIVCVGLAPYGSFEAMAVSAEVATLLGKFYSSPDELELYIGLVTEKNMKGGMSQPQTLVGGWVE